MIYKTEPAGFKPRFEIVGCFLERDGRILLLHRQDHRPEGNTWGLPSGKIEEGEETINAAVREVWEETGFNLPEERLSSLGRVFVRFPTYDFIYHIFRTDLAGNQSVRIDTKEHKDFRWVYPKDALDMPLIGDLENCIKLVYGLR